MIESLESRVLLAWGAYPHLIGLDASLASFGKLNGRGQAIALIDTGVDFNHPALAGKIWTNPKEIPDNGLDDDGDGYVDDVHGWDFYRNDNVPEDENGHGTQLTSIMTASAFEYNGATYQGVAPAARVIPLKVADPTGRIADIGFAQRIEKALQWVERNYKRYHIAAVNMSLRVQYNVDYQATFKDEIARLTRKGVFIVATSGRRADWPPDQFRFPSEDPNVLRVGILNSDNTISHYSQWNPKRDIFAPGNGVPVAMRGQTGFGAAAEATSYAAPWITATGALIKQVNPKFTPAQITAIIRDSAAKVTDLTTGISYKRLNLHKALGLAIKRAKKNPKLFSTKPIVAPG